ncbi:MAG: hypothetical protein WBF33_10250 [Candidatus Nitrosopolaris sp.]
MPTTRLPTFGPVPLAACLMTVPARSQPGRQPASVPWHASPLLDSKKLRQPEQVLPTGQPGALRPL